MFRRIFGDTFDFNHDGQMDSLEKRAEYMAVLDEVRQEEGIDKPLSEMNFDELCELSAKSGFDPGESGF